MKQRIKQVIMGLAIVLGFGVLAPAFPVGAVNVDPLQDVCNGSTSTVCASKNDNVSDTVTTVINVLLFVVGVISVIMIIVGGIMYTVSTGDASRISKAKFTIMYAVAGLVIALVAYAIVNWVIGRFV
jgi:small-conductance mechanosensitive channel